MDDQRRLKLIRKLKSEGHNGAAIVRAMRELDTLEGRRMLPRRDFLTLMSCEMGWSSAHGSTYFHTHYQPPSTGDSVLETSDTPLVAPYPVTPVRESLIASTESAVEWYLSRSQEVPRAVFEAKGRLKDAGRGAVYSYHFGDEDRDETIYVGITGAKVKSRLYTVTSPHAKATWWGEWNHMRFVPVECSGDRQVLELLLIVGLEPLVNRKPSAIDVGQFLYD